MEQNRHISDFSQIDWGDKVWKFLSVLLRPFVEIFYGIKSDTIPWGLCFFGGSFFGLFILFHYDYLFLRKFHLQALYPVKPHFYWTYCVVVMLSSFWMWGLFRTYQRRKLIEKLTDIMLSAGLKNATGKLPGFVFDHPIDDFTRKLRLKRSQLSKEKFENAKSTLESSLQVFIDEIRENRTSGTIDIIYSHYEMPQITYIDNIKEISPLCFVVGNTRAKQIKAYFKNVPHLMVAGQTGGGKSTFLRGLIITLYLNNKDIEFTLIDLKGGLEFQLFEDLKRVAVIPNVEKSIPALVRLQVAIENRMAVLKSNNCKDLDSYIAISPEKRKTALGVSTQGFLNRHLLVIDEAAEMFLSGDHAQSSQIQQARRILSQIARQGRAVGVHLVVATQRPDARALDPQVKANLTGVLCFQMLNDASSITVLGNGRATELPPIPGRAIWKSGSEMLEVQTPYLGTEEVDLLLEPYREIKKSDEGSCRPPSTPLTLVETKEQAPSSKQELKPEEEGGGEKIV